MRAVTMVDSRWKLTSRVHRSPPHILTTRARTGGSERKGNTLPTWRRSPQFVNSPIQSENQYACARYTSLADAPGLELSSRAATSLEVFYAPGHGLIIWGPTSGLYTLLALWAWQFSCASETRNLTGAVISDHIATCVIGGQLPSTSPPRTMPAPSDAHNDESPPSPSCERSLSSM